MAITSMEAAKIACKTSGWQLSNLQLHKILYIAQMMYAGKHHGAKLIGDESFQAWDYGPVLPDVYRSVSWCGSGPIAASAFNNIPDIDNSSSEVQEIIGATRGLMNEPPFRLVQFTHAPGGAWDKSYMAGIKGITIDQKAIKDEYQARFDKA